MIGGWLVATAMGATFTVDDVADKPDAVVGDGVCATAHGTCTLRAAVEEAESTALEDRVVLEGRVYALSLGDLSVTHPLTVRGRGSGLTVLRPQGHRAFDVLDTRWRLRGVTIEGGEADVGGAVRVRRVALDAPLDVLLEDVRFLGPVAHVRGGALDVEVLRTWIDPEPVGSVRLVDVAVLGAHAPQGGVLSVLTGRAASPAADLTVELDHVVVRDSVAVGDRSPLLSVYGDAAMSVRDARFQDNACGRHGALLQLTDVRGTVERTDLLRNDCLSLHVTHATSGGRGGDVRVTSSRFDGNERALLAEYARLEAEDVVVQRHGRSPAIASVQGNAEVWLRRSTVDANVGPAIASYYGSRILLENSTVSRNVGPGSEGAIVVNAFSSVVLDHVTVVANEALAPHPAHPQGAAVSLSDANSVLYVDASVFADNRSGGLPDTCGGPGLVVSSHVVTDAQGPAPCAGLGDGPGDLLGTPASPLPVGLGPARWVGGQRVVVPEASSVLVDAVLTCTVEHDQLGRVRPRDGDGDGSATCDIGAVER